MAKFPASGEINRKVADAGAAIAAISDEYQADAERVDTTDGISMDFGSWRFNLRSSNTEPVIRLNVEIWGDEQLMREKLGELLGRLDHMA
jgi:phosphomannomutase